MLDSAIHRIDHYPADVLELEKLLPLVSSGGCCPQNFEFRACEITGNAPVYLYQPG